MTDTNEQQGGACGTWGYDGPCGAGPMDEGDESTKEYKVTEEDEEIRLMRFAVDESVSLNESESIEIRATAAGNESTKGMSAIQDQGQADPSTTKGIQV